MNSYCTASARSISFSVLAVSPRLLGQDALPMTVFYGTWIKSDMSWLVDSRLSLPDASAEGEVE